MRPFRWARKRGIPVVISRPKLADLPDFVPLFTRGAVLADGDGNIWVRTTTLVQGQPMYDDINSKGALVDRSNCRQFGPSPGSRPAWCSWR